MSFKKNLTWGPGCLLAVGAFLAAWVILALVGTGLAVGAANAWILKSTFSLGWHAVWQRKLVSIGWGMLFSGGVGGLTRTRSN